MGQLQGDIIHLEIGDGQDRSTVLAGNLTLCMLLNPPSDRVKRFKIYDFAIAYVVPLVLALLTIPLKKCQVFSEFFPCTGTRYTSNGLEEQQYDIYFIYVSTFLYYCLLCWQRICVHQS